MIHDGVDFHNVAELREVSGEDGRRIQRVPESVRKHLNPRAKDRMVHPAGVEIRFVARDDPVRVTLSCPAGSARVVPFWGPFQGTPRSIGSEPTTLEMSVPSRMETLDARVVADSGWSPRVCRLRFDRDSSGLVYYHAVEGADVRLPREDEVPARTLLVYGTSITEGSSATRTHLTYPARAARELGVDLVNLGSSGSAYCEPEIADHVAARDDWDAAVLSVSVNMLGAGFAVEEFRERATYLVETVAASHPDSPVVCVTLFPLGRDVLSEDPKWDDLAATPVEYRRALREVVEAASRDNLTCVAGSELLEDVGGHTVDLLHPGDAGMIEMGANLAAVLEPLLGRTSPR